MRRWLLCGVLAAVSCSPTSPSVLPSVHEGVIRSEWAYAQWLLREFSVARVDLVTPERYTWIPHDGPVPYNGGFANGLYRPDGRIIRWNTRTPTVIRHEAGHAILDVLNNPCWACWSLDTTLTSHGPGSNCTKALLVYCDVRLKEQTP